MVSFVPFIPKTCVDREGRFSREDKIRINKWIDEKNAEMATLKPWGGEGNANTYRKEATAACRRILSNSPHPFLNAGCARI